MMKLKNPVLMASIGAPHGVRGDVRVKAFTADPLAICPAGPPKLKAATRNQTRSASPQETPCLKVVAGFTASLADTPQPPSFPKEAVLGLASLGKRGDRRGPRV